MFCSTPLSQVGVANSDFLLKHHFTHLLLLLGDWFCTLRSGSSLFLSPGYCHSDQPHSPLHCMTPFPVIISLSFLLPFFGNKTLYSLVCPCLHFGSGFWLQLILDYSVLYRAGKEFVLYQTLQMTVWRSCHSRVVLLHHIIQKYQHQ